MTYLSRRMAAALAVARGGRSPHSSRHNVNFAASPYRLQDGAVLAQRQVGLSIILLLSGLIVWAPCSRVAAQDGVPSWTTTLIAELRPAPGNLTSVQSVTSLASPSWSKSFGAGGYGLGLVMPVLSNTSTISCTMGIYAGTGLLNNTAWAWEPVQPAQMVVTSCDLVFSSGSPLRFFVNLTSTPEAKAAGTPYASWPPLSSNESSSSSSGATDEGDIHALALTDSGILLILDSANRTLWQSRPALDNSSALLGCPPEICSTDASAAAAPLGSSSTWSLALLLVLLAALSIF